jgi:ribosomal protein S16
MDANLQRQIEFAEAVAAGHRETASQCSLEQEALRTRLLQGAQMIETMVSLVRIFAMTAKINHDTVREMQQS